MEKEVIVKMKAVLLAAGKGDRLKLITTGLPKPMIEYKGKPILQYNIEACKQFGIAQFFINTHHLPDQIKNYFGDGNQFGVEINYSFEEVLLGTSGALNNFKKHLLNEPFFVIYADQIIKFDIPSLVEKYQQQPCLGTMAFHYREDVQHCGVAEFSKDEQILRFIEKPKPDETESHWVNAGIYYLNPEIFQFIPDGFSDFGREIFPNLILLNKRLFGVCRKIEFKVFDTPELYKQNILGENLYE